MGAQIAHNIVNDFADKFGGLLLDDPARDVDVGAKREMHALIRSIARAGAVVILCSTDN